MQRRVFVTAALAMGLLALMTACGGPSAISEENAPRFQEPVAEFDSGYSLSAFQLYDKLFRSTVLRAGGLVPDSTVKDFLDSVLVDTLAGLEADHFDLSARWRQYRVYRDQMYGELMKRFWEERVDNVVTVDSTEVQKLYVEHPELFRVQEQVDLYHILCSPLGIFYGPESLKVKNYSQDELWAAAEEYCNNLHKMLEMGDEVQNVALQYSHDVASKRNGGHVGWTGRGTYLDPFDSVAFALKAGEFSRPYKDDQGWHIVYVDARYDSGAVPLESPGMYEAAQEAALTIKQNQQSALVMDSLKSGLKIEYNEPFMATDLYAMSDSTWLAIVNGIDTVDVLLLKGSEEPAQQELKGKMSPADIRKLVIGRMAERFLVVQAARAMGIDTLPDMVRQAESSRRAKAKTLFLLEPYDLQWQPSDSAIRVYYNAHLDKYQPAKPVSVQMVTVKDSSQAEFLLAQVNSGFALTDLPKHFGKELGAKITYEDVGPIGADYVAPDVYQKALATLPGYYRLAVSLRGYHVLTVSKNTPTQTVEMATGEIKLGLTAQHRTQEFRALRDQLYAKYNVRFPVPMRTVHLPRLGDRLAGGK